MKLMTTLNEILKRNPCNANPEDSRDAGWNRLIDYLGHDYDRDAEINLLTILEANGVQDCLWALRSTREDFRETAANLAFEFAERALKILKTKYPKDKRSRKDIEAIYQYLKNPISENLGKIKTAMIKTACATYPTAAYATAFAAVYAIADASYTAAKANYAAKTAAIAAAIAASMSDNAVYTPAMAEATKTAYAAYAATLQNEKAEQAKIIRKYLS
jgi:hypothetical protein